MILVDSGPLIAAAIVKQRHYRECVDLLTDLGLADRRLLVPHTVVAEAAYMLHNYAGVRAESAFVRSLTAGDTVGAEILAIDHA
ncbi:MAG: hypothetical protein ACRCYU_18380 [Nocardioides sp.]